MQQGYFPNQPQQRRRRYNPESVQTPSVIQQPPEQPQYQQVNQPNFTQATQSTYQIPQYQQSPQYQQPVYQQVVYQQPPMESNPFISEKSKWIAFLLCFFGGGIGLHKFYLGKIGMGILYLFTLGLFGIGVLVDCIIIVCGNAKDKEGKLVTK